MPVTRRQFGITSIGLAVLSVIVWKAWITRDKQTAMEKLAADFVKLTTPDDAAIVQAVSGKRETWRVTATWEIETRQDWKEYTNWLPSKVGREFQKTTETESLIEFKKTQPSEILLVKAERQTHDPRHRVRVSLIVEPW